MSEAGRARLVCGYLAGMLLMSASGALWAWQAYIVQLHATLNTTTLQGIYIVHSSLLGLSTGGLAHGVLLYHVSAMWLCVAGCVLSTFGFLLFWSVTKAVQFYTFKSWLLAIYAFLSGTGLSCLYHTTLFVNSRNFGPRHAGKVFGSLHSSMWISALILNLLFGDQLTDWMNSAALFLVLMVLATGSSLFGILGLRSVSVIEINIDRERENTPGRRIPRTQRGSSYSDVRAYTTQAYEYAPDETDSIDNDDQEPDMSSSRNVLTVPGYSTVDGSVDDQSAFSYCTRTLFVHSIIFVIGFAFVSGPVWSLALVLDRGMLKHSDNFCPKSVCFFTGAILSGWIFGCFSDRFGREKLPVKNLLKFLAIFAVLGILVGFFALMLCKFNTEQYSLQLVALVILGTFFGGLFALFPVLMKQSAVGARHWPLVWATCLTVFVALAVLLQIGSYWVFEYGASCQGKACDRLEGAVYAMHLVPFITGLLVLFKGVKD